MLRYIAPLTGFVAAAPATAQFSYGSSCEGGSEIAPALEVDVLPVIGKSFNLIVTGPPNTAGLLGFGLDDLNNGVDLEEPGFEHCSLEVEISGVAPFFLPPDGTLVVPVETWPFPDLSFYVQALVIDPGATVSGGLSAGLELRAFEPPSAILITEILKDPDFSSDASGEWIELHNTTLEDVDIEGWTLADDGFDSTVLDNAGAGIIVPAGAWVTLGNGADPLTNGGLTHLFTYSDFSLANSSDEVILRDGMGVEIDRVDYLDTFLWPNQKGRSLSLDPILLDDGLNDDGSNWRSADCYLAGDPFNLDQGTPGAPNDQCTTGRPPTASGVVIFSEIMQNPASVADSAGEWFELHNTSEAAVDLMGYTVSFGATEVIANSVVIPAGGYALFARSGDFQANGGLPAPDYVWTSLALGNGSVTAQLFDPTGGLVAFVSYDNGQTFPDPSGASMTLDPGLLDQASSEDGANWCEATSSYGSGDLGTPGAPNDDCP